MMVARTRSLHSAGHQKPRVYFTRPVQATAPPRQVVQQPRVAALHSPHHDGDASSSQQQHTAAHDASRPHGSIATNGDGQELHRSITRDDVYRHPVYSDYGAKYDGTTTTIVNINTGKELEGSLTPEGYVRVCLRVVGKRVQMMKHKFVFECYVAPVPDGHIVITRDGNYQNANVDNLRMITRREQIVLMLARNPEASKKGAQTMGKAIICTYPDGTEETFASMRAAARVLSVDRRDVSRVLRGDLRAYRGFGFRFIEDVELGEQRDYEQEQWRTVDGFAGIEVSDMGRVHWLNNGRKHKGSLHHSGYLAVFVQRTRHPVHVLVCTAFNGAPPSENCLVNHLNEDKLDNRACNLQWIARSEYAHRARLKYVIEGRDASNGHVVRTWRSMTAAAGSLGVSPHTVSKYMARGLELKGLLLQKVPNTGQHAEVQLML